MNRYPFSGGKLQGGLEEHASHFPRDGLAPALLTDREQHEFPGADLASLLSLQLGYGRQCVLHIRDQ